MDGNQKHILCVKPVEYDRQSDVPCPDSITQVSQSIIDRFNGCVIKYLVKQCSRSLAGSWSDPANVVVKENRTCGLSNYLYLGYLKDHVPVRLNEPRKVLIRVYGEVLRSSVESTVLDAVNFALLSEKRMGPQLIGVFSGGRIEEYIEQSRPLTTAELSLSEVIEKTAYHMGRIHALNMPFCKQPTFILKMLEKFLGQLTGRLEPPHRPVSSVSTSSFVALEQEYDAEPYLDNSSHSPNFNVVHELTNKLQLMEEYEWLKSKLFMNGKNAFPVVFCHNDFQENNILVLNDPAKDGCYEMLPIDFEYSGYNFRGFDIGNHFNEWCYEYGIPHPPYFKKDSSKYPTWEQQEKFWEIYLTSFRTSRRNSVSFTHSGHEESDLTENGVEKPADFQKLWIETAYGSLYSHLFWAAWSLIQSQISSIQFHFDAYAVARMDDYYKMKSILLSATALEAKKT
ncbi:unnamed protein product [Calicophoron daubneyi]|uniref:Choline/ethanolamine kinase n=1 Tax=Calicophoron daubneyi TaxID=300641 RepID=A0AAV2TDT3_CALDB